MVCNRDFGNCISINILHKYHQRNAVQTQTCGHASTHVRGFVGQPYSQRASYCTTCSSFVLMQVCVASGLSIWIVDARNVARRLWRANPFFLNLSLSGALLECCMGSLCTPAIGCSRSLFRCTTGRRVQAGHLGYSAARKQPPCQST